MSPLPVSKMSDLLPDPGPVSPVFFVDLDGTLKSNWDVNLPEGEFDVSADWLQGGNHRYSARLGYQEFLQALKGMGTVNLSTAGGPGYVSTVLAQMSLESAFDKQYNANSWRHGIPYEEGAIFIDDDLGMAIQKVKCMSAYMTTEEARERLVMVEPYYGGPDNELMSALGRIKEQVDSICGVKDPEDQEEYTEEAEW